MQNIISFDTKNNKVINVSKSERMVTGTSSKGSQIRWFHNNQYVKLNTFGREDIAETIVSLLLRCSASEFAAYSQCKIIEDDIEIGAGCFSDNFLQNGECLVTFGQLLKRITAAYGALNYEDVRDLLYQYYNIDVQRYMDHCICLDAITRNEDRHFNNFAVILSGNSVFKTAPLFDNGLSCMSDLISYPLDGNFSDLYSKVFSKPFYTSFDKQVQLIKYPLELDVSEFWKKVKYMDMNEVTERALKIIDKGLKDLYGTAWLPKLGGGL